MYSPRFELEGFESLSRDMQRAIVRPLLESLVLANVAYLVANPRTPLLYSSGVRYEKEPGDRDNWQNIPRTLQLRTGDCEDLASWRCAELRVRGEHQAACDVRFFDLPGEVDIHVIVRRSDGSAEDPSRRLGMP